MVILEDSMRSNQRLQRVEDHPDRAVNPGAHKKMIAKARASTFEEAAGQNEEQQGCDQAS